ncbi:MAG TPA: alpha/beta fold hydrolase [Flavipsychrobacter sp.]
MKRILASVLFLVSMSAVQAQNSFDGTWAGALNGVQNLRMGFNVTGHKEGNPVATMDVPAQGAKDIPCDTVIVDGDSIHIKVVKINGRYDGKLAEVNRIDGLWTQNGMSISLILDRREGRVQLNRPQTPKGPFPYNSEDVLFYNENKSIEYGATITTPRDDKQHPAVILISGSGPQNRDEELFQHKPFAVVADHLTKNGYVVLRIDDRGVGKTTGDRSKATSEDFADDVMAAIEFLKKRKEVDRRKIGLYGHSEGGLIAQLVASRSKDVDFIILMAAPGVPITQAMAEQNIALMKTVGLTEEQANKYGELYSSIVKGAITAQSRDAAEKNINKALNNWIANTDEATVVATTNITDEESKEKLAYEFLRQLYDSKWMMYFMQYDPKPVLEKLDCKVLALNGDRDIQVISRSNLEGINKALANSKSKEYEVREVEGVNHLFQECKTCTAQEYGQLEQTIKPEVLEIVTTWLDQNVK